MAKKALQKGSMMQSLAFQDQKEGVFWWEIIKEWQQRWDQELKGRHL